MINLQCNLGLITFVRLVHLVKLQTLLVQLIPNYTGSHGSKREPPIKEDIVPSSTLHIYELFREPICSSSVLM